MQTTRKYVSKTHGYIGEVELVSPDGTWTLDGVDLPTASIKHLVYFALQTLQDTYGKKDQSKDEAQAAWAKKLAALKNGTIGSREVAADPVDRHAKAIATDDVDKALKAKKMNVSKEKRRELIADRMTKPEVVAEAKRRAAADKRQVSADDILGDLLDGESEDADESEVA